MRKFFKDKSKNNIGKIVVTSKQLIINGKVMEKDYELAYKDCEDFTWSSRCIRGLSKEELKELRNHLLTICLD